MNPEPNAFDALVPRHMAVKAEESGVAKAEMAWDRMLVLAMLAGAFIAFGALFSTVVSTTGVGVTPTGPIRLAAGVAFSLGLVLVVVGGAELFTGNNLIVMAWASRRVSTRSLIRNWVIVYVGNFVGAIVIAYLTYRSGHFDTADGALRVRALGIATAKTELSFTDALLRGVLANVLVCLAVWMCASARSVVDKVVIVILPISAFVVAGFEHSVANMYFIPVGLFLDDGTTGSGPLTWSRFLTHNLAPVTLGNIIGGALLVGLVYWFVYLRHDAEQATTPTSASGSAPIPQADTHE